MANEKKTFLTYFPLGENEHLAKDVGIIPNIMAKNFGYESYLAVYDRGQEFEYLNSITKNLKIWKVKSFLFFVKNARKINIVNFYHLNRKTKILSIIYKLFNRNGFVYIKADINPYAKIKMGFLYSMLFKKIINLISVENELSLYHFLKWRDKTIYIPNGIDFDFLENLGFKRMQKTDKEKLIITVGRIGTSQKNNQIMLEALNGLDLRDWKFAFIGPISNETNMKLEEFYLNNPNLKDKVIFTGGIYDKKELYSWYKKASAFCLTSKFESWCLALSDAIYFGCEIISTNVGCFSDITRGDFGYEISNAGDLRNILEKIISGEIDVLQNFEKIIKQSKNFSWNKICERLQAEINCRISF